MEQAERRPTVQELRTPDKVLLGKIKRGRWLIIRRHGRYHSFDLWEMVETPRRAHRPLDADEPPRD